MGFKTGNRAPSFSLPASTGGELALGDLEGKITVLYFYPRDNTPGCTVEANEFQALLPEFEALGAEVIGISKDSLASHKKFSDKYGLTFPLLTDESTEMMADYGAWGEKSMYGKKFMGIIRSTVVIDQDGKVAEHWPKVRAKGHAEAVLEFVRGLAN